MKDSKQYTTVGVCIVVILMFFTYGYVEIFSVPKNFPIGKNFTVGENENLKSVSKRLENGGYITSPLLFRAGISFFGKDREIQLGGYVFDKPESLAHIVDIFVKGHPSSPLLSVTIPEGSTSFEIASIITKVLPGVTKDMLSQTIAQYNADGRLFPSTYFLLPSNTAEDIVKLMLYTFSKKVAPLSAALIPSPLTTEHDVLVLASILEGEAKSGDDMKIVSGILLARLTKGMLLQVDVAKETYKNKGLPKIPINNPGLTAIDAVLHPILSNYLYYITGDDEKMYYAKTFEEHKRNIRKYLK